MAITIVGTASTSNSGTTNGGAPTLSTTMPTIQANDVAIAVVTRGNASAITTNPTGFTLLSNTSNGTLVTTTIWYKVLVGNESGATVTAEWATSGYSSMALVVYRGVDTANTFDTTFTSGTDAGAADTDLTYPAITTVSQRAKLLYISGTVRSASGAGYTHTPPTGFNEDADITSSRNNSLNAGIVISSKEIVTPTTVSSDTTGTVSVSTYEVSFAVVLRQTAIVIGDGILSDEAFGSPFVQINQNVFGTGIGSDEAFGDTYLNGPVTLLPTNIPTQEAFGSPFVNAKKPVFPTNIPSSESVGTPFVNAQKITIPTAIPSQEAFGSAYIKYGNVAYVTAIPSEEAFGTPFANKNILLMPLSISDTGVGTPFINAQQRIVGIGIASSEALGSALVTPKANTLPTAIPSAEALGSPFINAQQVVKTISIDAGNLGTPFINQQSIAIAIGIGTAQALGTPLTKGSTVLLPTSIAPAAMGTPYIKNIAYAKPTNIASLEAFGSPLTKGSTILLAVGIDDSAIGAVGTPTITPSSRVLITGIASAQAFGFAKALQPQETWGMLTIG